ncbi:MAG: arylsulfatase [Bacteroidota bacterium]
MVLYAPFKPVIGTLLLLMLLSLCSCADPGREKNSPPNVILVLVDDLGIGDLSLYGQETLSTPNLDRMAAEGMYFTNMYTGSTVCAPSRASLLTGKHTGHCSVRGNRPWTQIVGDDELTLAGVFKEAGYVTGAIGKWGVGAAIPEDDPEKKGFDYFYGYLNMWHAHNFYPEFLWENGTKVYLNNKTKLVDGVNPWADTLRDGRGVAELREDYAHYIFDEKAVSFIEENADHQFFLYLAYNLPHANNDNKENGMLVHDYHEYAEKDWPIEEKGFAAMIRNIDNSMDLILGALKENRLDKNTLVLFCSDNGPHQEGGHRADFFNSNGNYKGRKRDLYEGGVRTPFIAWWPGRIEAGTRSDELFAFWDFLPTFAELTDYKGNTYSDGISFLPSLFGREQEKQHDYLYWEFNENRGKQAIIKDRWKAVKLNVSVEGAGELELYNLDDDPGEQNNVATGHPEIVKEIEELFVSARTESSLIPLLPDEIKPH